MRMHETMRKGMASMGKRTLAVDALALAVFIVACNPSVTGVAFHEWLGLAVTIVLIVHCAMHFDGIVHSVRAVLMRHNAAAAGRLALNVATFLAFAVCCVSGLCESGSVLQALGLFMDGYYLWNPLHAVAAKVLLALVVVHLAINARRVFAYAKGRKEAHDGQ